jgi:thioredoxin reductase/ferredoxin
MSTWTIVLGFIAIAAIPYFLWSWIEARKHRRAVGIADDIASLGPDLIPISLHPAIALDECIGSGACVRACPEHDVLAMVGGHVALVNPLACVGHGACAAACPVGAIRLVFGTATRGVELPRLTAAFETTQPGIFVAGELGGMGLIRNAVEQGRQVATEIVRADRRGGGDVLDAIVVGAGPAGIATTLGLLAAGRQVLLVEQERYGGTIRHYPRDKVVMTGALELPGYGKVRRRTMRKGELLALWDDIRARIALPLREGTRVSEIARVPGGWRVSAEDWSATAANVVLALGRRGAPRRLGVAGEELAKVHYRVLEPARFAGPRVLVVGGGTGAADAALALAGSGGCASVTLSYRRAQLARMRGSVRARVEDAIARGAIQARLETEVVEIGAEHVRLRGPTGDDAVPNDAVIVQIGGTAPDDLLRTVGIDVVEKRGEA